MAGKRGRWIRLIGHVYNVYLGLVQERSLYMTPPPQVREQSDHWDQADHWPWTALGPCSPYLTHWPRRHHWAKRARRKWKKDMHRNSFLISIWAWARASCLSFLDWINAQHYTWIPRTFSSRQSTHAHTHSPRPNQSNPNTTLTHHHFNPSLISDFNIWRAPAIAVQLGELTVK